MFELLAARALLLLPLFFMQTANAFFDQPLTSPSNPTAHDVLGVVIHGGVCDTIFYRPGYPQITQDGSTIHILEFGQHWDPGELCTYSVGTLTEQIGPFDPGEYAIVVELRYLDFFQEPQTLLIGVARFVVSGSPAVAAPVPADSPTVLVLIAMSLVLAAAVTRFTPPREG